MKTVRDILEVKGRTVWSVDPGSSVFDALGLMAEKEIGALVVLDGARVMCALHGAVFRLDDGYCEAGPAATSSLETVEVVVRDGSVCIADRDRKLAP